MLNFSFDDDRPRSLHHGGRLRIAAAHYDIPLDYWLDLSTGINPSGWTVNEFLPPSVWMRLPEEEDGLEAAARDYYGTSSVLPVAGTQAAIQTIPRLIAPGKVCVLNPSYAEHAYAWLRAGHRVTPVTPAELDEAAAESDVMLLVHPNNPTGLRFELAQLLRWHETLAARGGWLIVDEAFIDATPEQSLTPYCPRPWLIVLRSLGKFFGLAGARVGFVCAEPSLLKRLQLEIGPWTVTGPSRWIATRALDDAEWQQRARLELSLRSERLTALLCRYGLRPHDGCALFQWIPTPTAAQLHDQFARRGVLTRLFDTPASLRIGLPGPEPEWRRLESALAEIRTDHLLESPA